MKSSSTNNSNFWILIIKKLNMPIQKDDLDKITGILSWKLSEPAINRIIEKINKDSYYYELKDSPFNRPTVWKLFSLAVFAFCSFIFVIQPLFFWKSSSIVDIWNKSINESVALWWLPPLTSFEYQVFLKEVPNKEWQQLFELTDQRWNVFARTDIINWYWKAIFWKLSNGMELTSDNELINITNWELTADKQESIKEILKNWLKYDIYTPKFNSIDYWVDQIINWWN